MPMSKNSITKNIRQCNPLVMRDDVREALRAAKRERGLNIGHTGNQAIRYGLPIVLENLDRHMSPEEALAAVRNFAQMVPSKC